MKRSIDGTIKKAARRAKTRKSKEWTTEQDLNLRDLISKEKITSWPTICRRLNKLFPTQKTTARDCETRWELLNSSLTLNEELVLLISFYRDKLQIAEKLLETRTNVKDHVLEMVEKMWPVVEEVRNGKALTTLSKLQFFVCVDLALNSGNELVEPMRMSMIDWLEVAQYLLKQKAKMTKEGFHEFVDKMVLSIEDKISILLESEVNGLQDVMHERKDNPSQLSQGINYFSPFMGMNFFLLASSINMLHCLIKMITGLPKY
eukprot:TRINITY_DN9629_c0_g2_i7.p1 TRINITY_DN9629_c0_g2~~TRINITY_DN9629_c0_g2_i7.p1  ORF type:complete len:274 (+),score=76.60 TRINITY_DN9629_c0_g2_i7:40-822(+)